MSNKTSEPQHILVMGVGRSGTTALYRLLQHILEAQYPGDVDYVYEPFLWDRKIFNKPYLELSDEFAYTASISIEGIYHHKQIPLIVNKADRLNQESLNWLGQTLNPRDGKNYYLGKMIRANGRVRAVKSVTPEIRIIFIIRNPIDVLNSSSQLFSFFGNEFYESDLSRFREEVSLCYPNDPLAKFDPSKRIKSEFAYWYFSNLAFLDYANANPQNFLTIAYEEFVRNRESVVREICRFLGLEFDPDFVVASQKTTGFVKQHKPGLNRFELQFLQGKLDAYIKILRRIEVVPSVPIGDLVKTDSWSDQISNDQRTPYYNAFHLGRQLAKLQLQYTDLEKLYRASKSDAAEIRASKRLRFVNWLLYPLDKLRELFHKY